MHLWSIIYTARQTTRLGIKDRISLVCVIISAYAPISDRLNSLHLISDRLMQAQSRSAVNSNPDCRNPDGLICELDRQRKACAAATTLSTVNPRLCACDPASSKLFHIDGMSKSKS